MQQSRNTNWIWTEEYMAEDRQRPVMILFRKKVELPGKPVRAKLQMTADTRYKLYVNGALVEAGPAKGDSHIWYVDTLDLTEYLRAGINVIAAEVLRYPAEGKAGNHSMFRTALPGLYVKGTAESAEGDVTELSADASWKCRRDRNITFPREEERFAPLMIHENAAGDPGTNGWKMPAYDDSTWKKARLYSRSEVSPASSPDWMTPRRIPFLYRRERQFRNIYDCSAGAEAAAAWEQMIHAGKKLLIPAGSELTIVLDAGEEMTGYLRLLLSGGGGAKIELLESEAYVISHRMKPQEKVIKGNRLDKINGHLEGYTDHYTVAGYGTENSPEQYEPFWFRTFRFVQLRIRTGEAALLIHAFDYQETGYPLEVQTKVETSDASLSEIWEISERTLRRCMHETYEDCPFYEQLQYAMDTRSQILYTYSVAADDRLARNAMDDFSRAQRADGLLNCCYPDMNTNVIPGFSVYYILMVHDHMMYFGDRKLVREALPVIERILNFFDDHLTENGLVEKIGGMLDKSPYWSFIDWAADWNPISGMPPAGKKGPITMESLLYILGLQKAAELSAYIGRRDTAGEYRKRAQAVQKAVRSFCMLKNGMVTDGPGSRDVSQHCQVFGILTDTLSAEEGRKNLLATVRDRNRYTQCTVAMSLYLFRALERTDLYDWTDHYWDVWRQMIANGCTTCVEAEDYSRSECHAWGALSLYELPSVVLGVRPAEPGYQAVSIRPVPGYLKSASGTVITPRGRVEVSWEKRNGELKLNYHVPKGLRVIETRKL